MGMTRIADVSRRLSGPAEASAGEYAARPGRGEHASGRRLQPAGSAVFAPGLGPPDRD